jgi:hypothetical protein
MDSQFNTLIRSYHDNYLEHKITGSPSYQQAYQLAKEGIDTILSSMENEKSQIDKTITNFQSENVEQRLRDIQSQKLETQRKDVAINDQLVSAEMRSKSVEAPAQQEPLTSRYIALGVMIATSVVLMVM